MQSSRNAAYAAQIARIRTSVEQFMLGRFLTGSYRDADLKTFLAAVVPVALAGRRQVSALTDAHLSQVMSAKLGRSVRPSGPIDTALLRGVDPAEVYARPHQTVWWKLSTGLALDEAVSAGKARLSDIVLGDLQLAKLATAKSALTESGVPGYVRVTSGGSCELCSSDLDVVYAPGEQMPSHPGCDCSTDPVTDEPSGAQSEGVVVHEHGELGPVLAVAGQHFAAN